jgi:WD40 repeat protein
MVDILTRRVAFAHYLELGKCRTETWRKHRGFTDTVTRRDCRGDNGHVEPSSNAVPVLRIDVDSGLNSPASYTSPNGDTVIAVACNNGVTLWNANSGMLLGSLSGHQDSALMVKARGGCLVSADIHGLRLWHSNVIEPIRDIDVPDGIMDLALFGPLSNPQVAIITEKDELVLDPVGRVDAAQRCRSR